MPPRPLNVDSLTFSYVGVRTSQETALHDLLGHIFTFLYADDIPTSQETALHGLLRR
jgi:hypothetical protein